MGWSDKLLPMDRADWTDATGFTRVTKADHSVTSGWQWEGLWQIDKRDADQDGFHYAVQFYPGVTFEASMSSLHHVRRRRWVRKQVRAPIEEEQPASE
jgi:hypothetical protein